MYFVKSDADMSEKLKRIIMIISSASQGPAYCIFFHPLP